MINAIIPLYPVRMQQINYTTPVIQKDSVKIENPHINKKPLIDRKIVKEDENINEFFDKISSEIFPNSSTSNYFSQLLKYGFVSLSSSCYEDLKMPYSAKAVKLQTSFSKLCILRRICKRWHRSWN